MLSQDKNKKSEQEGKNMKRKKAVWGCNLEESAELQIWRTDKLKTQSFQTLPYNAQKVQCKEAMPIPFN